MESLSTQFPDLARSREVHFRGAFHDPSSAEMEVTLQTETPSAAALAAKLGDWLAGREGLRHPSGRAHPATPSNW